MLKLIALSQCRVPADRHRKKNEDGEGESPRKNACISDRHCDFQFTKLPGPPPPFYNPLFQTLPAGAATPDIGLYLWNRKSVSAVGVDLQMSNPSHWRLVQRGRTVGQVWIQAPPGASDFGLTSSGPSVEVDAFPFTLGVRTGLLKVQFYTDPSVAGNYIVDISINGGNAERLSITTSS